jgi:hypothetical protein
MVEFTFGGVNKTEILSFKVFKANLKKFSGRKRRYIQQFSVAD